MNEEVECTTKKWGSSIGIVIPKSVVEREHIKPNERIRVSVKKVVLAKDIWNLGPIVDKEPTQKIKDWMRKGW
ncbi:MAG: AbrB/MazE/SpoVT family DNA-binding domain-containing protein [Nanoarchaeota archaeon]|nr:MAG: AbrB/MazE/SpoVT family DNA-binding domain-containing protein [Nanoarchaeota archaeon]